MSEFKHSICFLISLSYHSYLDEARRLLRSLNWKFRNYYALTFSSKPGAIEYHFKREELFLEEKHMYSKKSLRMLLDMKNTLKGLQILLIFCKTCLKNEINPELLSIDELELFEDEEEEEKKEEPKEECYKMPSYLKKLLCLS